MKHLLSMAAFALASAIATPSAQAHLNWSQANDLDSFQWAQYDFEGLTGPTVTSIPVRSGFRPELNLGIVPLTAAPATGTIEVLENDGPYSFMGDAIRVIRPSQATTAPFVIRSARRLDKETSTNTNPGFISSPLRPDGVFNVTIEFWYRWQSPLQRTRFDVGLQSGPKIRVSRDANDPTFDQYRLELVHGDFAEFTGFTNWQDIDAQGEGEADLDFWHHVGITITTPGFRFDTTKNHDVYLPGSVMHVWHNGHIFGTAPNFGIDLTDKEVHEFGTIQIRLFEGRIDLDGLTVWDGDLSDDGVNGPGSNLNPFANGRGDGFESLLTGTATTVRDWMLLQ